MELLSTCLVCFILNLGLVFELKVAKMRQAMLNV